MENITFKGYKDIFYFPDINFDAENGICEISGESFLENSVKFYQPYMDWMKEYFLHNESLTINFKLTYFNTSSSKRILDILRLLKKQEAEGKKPVVNWFFTEDDDDIMNEVEDFSIVTGMKINMIDQRKK